MPSEFDKIELPDPPKSASRVTRKGKKSLAWDADPEILKRLTSVAEMMIQGKYSWQIAEANKCSIATAKRDVGRVRELWKQAAKEKMDSLLGDSLATYTKVQEEAWSKVKANPEKADRFLAVILSAQAAVDKLAGIEKPPDPLEVNLNVEVRDIEQVRNERWRQVEGAMKSLVRQQKKEAK